MLETLSAFANTRGGLLIIGLAEKRGYERIPGFDAQRVRDKLLTRCQQLTPSIHPNVTTLTIEGDTPLVVAEIPEIMPRNKPCYITKQGVDGGSFRRASDSQLDSNVALTPAEIDFLSADKAQPGWDENAVDGATRADLDESLLLPYLERQEKLHPEAPIDAMFLADQPTLATLLALGKNPQRLNPGLTVAVAMFAGASKSDILNGKPLLFAKNLVGPIPSLVDQTVALVQQFGGGFDLAAVREAVVNALCHRDYAPAVAHIPVHVNMFSDRLEITSPGGLFGGITTRDLGEPGFAVARNTQLARHLAGIVGPRGVLAHNRGLGMQTIAAAGVPQPGLTQFTVVFPKPAVPSGASGTNGAAMQEGAQRNRPGKTSSRSPGRTPTVQRKVVAAFEDSPTLSAAEVVQKTGLSRSAVQKALNQLIAAGAVAATASSRSPKQQYRWLPQDGTHGSTHGA